MLGAALFGMELFGAVVGWMTVTAFAGTQIGEIGAGARLLEAAIVALASGGMVDFAWNLFFGCLGWGAASHRVPFCGPSETL